MSDYHINALHCSQDRGYIANIPDLKHCSVFGEIPEEALRELMLAKAAWLETAGTHPGASADPPETGG